MKITRDDDKPIVVNQANEGLGCAAVIAAIALLIWVLKQ